ncbi:MAG TPA: hypothetical protein V6D08_18595 [Candidatus Obscuribacterales bacterium]
MLIYVLIAVELAILYTAFWYVYVREPRPIRIRGNPWGGYGDAGCTTGGADPALPFLTAVAGHDLSVTKSNLEKAIGRQTVSMLPAWLVGNPTITQEFLQAWRLLRNGALGGTRRSAETSAYIRRRPGRFQGRRAKRCHSRLVKLLCGRRKGSAEPTPRPPLLSRLMKIVTRTLSVLSAKQV